jgi:hypothetical protein
MRIWCIKIGIVLALHFTLCLVFLLINVNFVLKARLLFFPWGAGGFHNFELTQNREKKWLNSLS